MDKHLEAAAREMALYEHDFDAHPCDTCRDYARKVIEAWVGDRELYEMQKRDTSTDHRMKWIARTVGYELGHANELVRVSVEGNENGCFCDADTLEAEGKHHQRMTHGVKGNEDE